MSKYSIGLDFGTLSGRAVLVNLETGQEAATSVLEYPHAVMDSSLPCGKKLDVDWALQHPQDYLDVIKSTIPDVLKQANVSADDVVGVGIDFTACTVLPTYSDGTPLCFIDKYKSEPHSYVKLWKHHAAQKYADRLNEIASERGEEFLKLYGGKISSEWLVPKVWQIAEEAPEIYDEMDRFIEAADWIVWQLTGNETRNSCTAGYKALWHKQKGFPSNEFFKALHPKLENLVEEKLSRNILPLGSKAGEINEYAASLTGLKAGTPVAVGNVDAHVAVPAVGITDEGKMLMIMGTSTCHMLLGRDEKIVPGMCGVVEDGIMPGYMGYEAGQSCVGDHFDWFVKNCVPESYMREAESLNINIHKLLREKAKKFAPGESGLVALDWWNGNRSVLVDADLSGIIAGMTLLTKPEEIYRALIEATAYGTRIIIETFNKHGLKIDELFACGGIAQKDELMMQIYADVTNRTIKISASKQTPALGSAMFGAVVGGYFRDLKSAAKVMAKLGSRVYTPIAENVKIYNRLYREYEILHDYFGRGENNLLKRLKEIRKDARK
jgi:L-ribulokinase